MLRPLLIAACCLPLCLNGVRADDSAPPPPERKFTDKELDDARLLKDGLTPEHQMLINGLRYLLRPEYETEMMAGRAFSPCTLDPFEKPGKGPLSQMEALRLWAVLQSGMAIDVSMHIARLLETPAPKDGENLASFGVLMATCLEVQRAGLCEEAVIKKKATEILNAAMKERSATDINSPLISGVIIDTRWFANHLWRGVICRSALAMQLKFNERVWENDLRNLAGQCRGATGWASPGCKGIVTYDLNANLLALAAISLGLTAPADALGDGLVRGLQRTTREVPGILSRLLDEFPSELLDGGRLAVLRTFAPDFAPEGLAGAGWQAAQLRRALDAGEPAGGVRVRNKFAGEMGLGKWGTHFGRQPADTALSCIALSGGLFREVERPLKGLDLATIGRAMHALSVLHANSLPVGVKPINEVDEFAAMAIEDGCLWLEKQQYPNGGWGPYPDEFMGPANARVLATQRMGYTAMAILALMHGGRERDHPRIKKALDWIVEHGNTAINNGRTNPSGPLALTTTDAGQLLMALQKYYEPEQAKAGVLTATTRKEFEAARKVMFSMMERPHRKLVEELVRFIDDAWNKGDNGGWYYGPQLAGGPDMSSNSTSQYAMMGYRSASLLGAVVNTRVFFNEARRLMRQYYGDGRFKHVTLEREETLKGKPHVWKHSIQPGGWGVSGSKLEGKGAALGISLETCGAVITMLAIARDEMLVREELDLSMARDIDAHLLGAQAWMAANYDDVIDGTGGYNTAFPISVYGNLYMIERGMVLAGIESLHGQVDWYDGAARAIIDGQWPDGSWPCC